MVRCVTQMANDDYRRPAPEDRVTARTSKRVAELSEAERQELAREFARRKQALVDTPDRPAVDSPRPAEQAPEAPRKPEAGRAEAAARVAAELRSTQRHLDRIERSVQPGRYGGSAPTSARYDRLMSRAERLERQLRALR